MTKGLLFGAGLGAAAMFLLDPARGKRRRALLRDKLAQATRMTGDCLDVTTRDVTNRTRGWYSEIKSRLSSEQPDDAVLVDRVRAKLGRVVSHPSAITVMAQNGTVTLTGPVRADEVPHLLSCVKWTAGVQHVNNDLDIHEAAENHPALQGGGERPGWVHENWSPTARLLAGAAGASLAVYGGTRRNALGAGLAGAGLLLMTRGITNTELTELASQASRQLHLGGSSYGSTQPTA